MIFTIRTDAFDSAEHGYSSTCEAMEKEKTWELVSKKQIEQHTAPDHPKFRYGYVITYKVLKN